jgi:hypothetical protein
MGVMAHVINFASLSVTVTETQRKTTLNAPHLTDQDARKPEDRQEIHPQRFFMLGLTMTHITPSFGLLVRFHDP